MAETDVWIASSSPFRCLNLAELLKFVVNQTNETKTVGPTLLTHLPRDTIKPTSFHMNTHFSLNFRGFVGCCQFSFPGGSLMNTFTIGD